LLRSLGTRDSMDDLSVDPKTLATLSSAIRPMVLPYLWAEFGFDVKQIQLIKLLKTGVEITCVACEGEQCVKHTVRVQFPSGPIADASAAIIVPQLLPPPLMNLSLARRLLYQPLAKAVLLGMGFFSFACEIESVWTDAFVEMIGGRGVGWYVLIATVVAHLLEGVVCFVITQQARSSHRDSLIWFALASFVGWPVTRHALKLRSKATK